MSRSCETGEGLSWLGGSSVLSYRADLRRSKIMVWDSTHCRKGNWLCMPLHFCWREGYALLDSQSYKSYYFFRRGRKPGQKRGDQISPLLGWIFLRKASLAMAFYPNRIAKIDLYMTPNRRHFTMKSRAPARLWRRRFQKESSFVSQSNHRSCGSFTEWTRNYHCPWFLYVPNTICSLYWRWRRFCIRDIQVTHRSL